MKRGGPEDAGQGRVGLVKRNQVSKVSHRWEASAPSGSRRRQPVTGNVELPVPAALVRQAARRDPGGREPDLETWARLTPAQRRQAKWRALASEWHRAAATKAEFIAVLAGNDRPTGLSLSVDEARQLLGSEPDADAVAPLIRALRVDPQEMPVTTGLFSPTDDEETPS